MAQIPARVRLLGRSPAVLIASDESVSCDMNLAPISLRKIEFTRCRAYQKNDQAWIEQKNGSVVRRLVGHERFTGIVAGQALAHLYKSARLYVNYFQPSFKLLSKSRTGAKWSKRYGTPLTPCERLLRHPTVDRKAKARLRSVRDRLDPLELLHQIREGQAALAQLVSETHSAEGPGRKTLDQFLSTLPVLWKSGEVRPTHRQTAAPVRYWRTRKDPFESVWLEVLEWLQREPDATAKDLFLRLQSKYLGRFQNGQLRTLQRRVKEWRQLMATQLVYTCMNIKDNLSENGHIRAIGESQTRFRPGADSLPIQTGETI